MISRKDAQQARDGMERYKSPDMQLRVSGTDPSCHGTMQLTRSQPDAMGGRLRASRLQRLLDWH